MGTESFQIEIRDVEFLQHNGRPFLARLYEPRGTGPFPALVEVHGGTWCNGDRLTNQAMDDALARRGIVVMAIDFRMPPEAGYPASVADINYAIRWLKSRAKEVRSRSDVVGIIGTSSGGHQAVLAGMRPHDPRYSALPLPPDLLFADARVLCVIACWPVIDPLGRYLYARELCEAGEPGVAELPLSHDQYWGSHEAMAEGNPLLALERGEEVDLPPILALQGELDVLHPVGQLRGFVRRYRAAGGHIELELVGGVGGGWPSPDYAPADFISRDVVSVTAHRALEKISKFVREATTLA
jgi:acetyl esterase